VRQSGQLHFIMDLANYSLVLPLAMNSQEVDSPHLQWLKDKLSNKEAISMPDFATNFKYLSESDADMALSGSLPFRAAAKAHAPKQTLLELLYPPCSLTGVPATTIMQGQPDWVTFTSGQEPGGSSSVAC